MFQGFAEVISCCGTGHVTIHGIDQRVAKFGRHVLDGSVVLHGEGLRISLGFLLRRGSEMQVGVVFFPVVVVLEAAGEFHALDGGFVVEDVHGVRFQVYVGVDLVLAEVAVGVFAVKLV